LNNKLYDMKHIYTLIACLLIGTASFAQLPDGSIAPDFTATDIDGVEHNLYDLLDEGKKSNRRLFCDMVRTLLGLPHERSFRRIVRDVRTGRNGRIAHLLYRI